MFTLKVLCLAILASIFDPTVSQEEADYYRDDGDIVTRQATEKCFEHSTISPASQERYIEQMFEDPAVAKCYTRFHSQKEVFALIQSDASSVREQYDKFRDNFCPSWSEGKNCLKQYIKNRCSTNETSALKASSNFNVEVGLSSLMCEPVWKNRLRFMLERAKETGLFKCVVSGPELEFSRSLHDCTVGAHQETGVYPPFKSQMREFHACGSRFMDLCAGGDKDKLAQLQKLFKMIMTTIDKNIDVVWKNLEI